MANALRLQNATLKISAGLPNQFPGDPIPGVAFSGRSNVGKSSLINVLLGRKSLARVSSAPGKTITVNFYSVDGGLFLIDLPGYGFAKRPPEDRARWSALTDGFFTNNKNLDRVCLVLQLIDLKVGPTQDDLMMLDYLTKTGLPFAVVATKADKLNKTDTAKAMESLKNNPALAAARDIIPFSALNGTGKNEVWAAVCSACNVRVQ